MDTRFENISKFINSYADKTECKLIYFNVFNILTGNKKEQNYTCNNNGIHFILNDVSLDKITVLEEYILNFKKVLNEKKYFDDERTAMISEFNIDNTDDNNDTYFKETLAHEETNIEEEFENDDMSIDDADLFGDEEF